MLRAAISLTGPGRHLLIKSLAGGVQPLKNARKNVWYTGENERPPFGEWDAYFSFEIDSMRGKNIYWPQAWLATNLLFPNLTKTPWNSTIFRFDKAIRDTSQLSNKRKFACAFIGKIHPTRLHMLKLLSEMGKVDIFGEASRRKVESKIEIARSYKFLICPENDLYPGYVTEKPVEAYVSTCIPLYSGIDSFGILNSKALVNYANMHSQEEFFNSVRELHTNRDQYESVYSERLFKKRPRLENAVAKIKELLN
jgi:hypothetical protein